jgi:hypothetical protein
LKEFPDATAEIVAVALCAWLEMAAAAKPAATTRERRIELIFDIIVMVLPFYFGVIDPAQAWISVILGMMTKPGKCSLRSLKRERSVQQNVMFRPDTVRSSERADY